MTRRDEICFNDWREQDCIFVLVQIHQDLKNRPVTSLVSSPSLEGEEGTAGR